MQKFDILTKKTIRATEFFVIVKKPIYFCNRGNSEIIKHLVTLYHCISSYNMVFESLVDVPLDHGIEVVLVVVD